MSTADCPPPANRPRPPQFHLSTLMGATAAVAAVFGGLRWLGVPQEAACLVLGLLVVCGLAAGGLVLSLRRSLMAAAEPESDRNRPDSLSADAEEDE